MEEVALEVRGGRNIVKKEQHIADFRRVHGDRYNYAEFRNSDKVHKVKDKIPIICRKHGLFKQAILSHKKGHGCIECSYELRGVKNRDGEAQNTPKRKQTRFNERLLSADTVKKNPEGYTESVTRELCAGVIKRLPLHELEKLYDIKFTTTEHGGTLISVSLK